MKSSKYKHSFMIQKDFIPDFIDYLTANNTQKVTSKSRFELYRGTLENQTIIIYRSGIVLFGSSKLVSDIINHFFAEKGWKPPDIESYTEFSETTDFQDTKSGKDTLPKGVWLTKDQIKEFTRRLTKMNDIILSDSQSKNEELRFEKKDDIIIINRNQVVYSPTGFHDLNKILTDAIDEKNDYDKYEFIVAIDETGSKSIVGPALYSFSILNNSQVKNLQLGGVKHSSIGRGANSREAFNLINAEKVVFHSEMIFPEEFNEGSIEDLIRKRWINFTNKIKETLEPKISTRPVLLLNSSTMDIDLGNLEVTVKRVNPKDQEIGIPISISSVISQFYYDSWKNKIETENKLKIRNDKIGEIKLLPSAKSILKFHYLKRNH